MYYNSLLCTISWEILSDTPPHHHHHPVAPPFSRTHRRMPSLWICMRGSTHTPHLLPTSLEIVHSPFQIICRLMLPQIYSGNQSYASWVLPFPFFMHIFFFNNKVWPPTRKTLKICGAEPQWWNKWCNACVGVCGLMQKDTLTDLHYSSLLVFAMLHVFMHDSTRGILGYSL